LVANIKKRKNNNKTCVGNANLSNLKKLIKKDTNYITRAYYRTTVFK